MVLHEVVPATVAGGFEAGGEGRPRPPAPSWRQSPIDIPVDDAVPESGLVPVLGYAPTMVSLWQDQKLWRESTVFATVQPYGSGGGLTWRGEEYTLHSVHWHTPSEHALDGTYFPMEQHMRHDGPDGRILVLSTFVTDGPPGALDDLLRVLPAEGGEPHAVTGFDARALLPPVLDSYQYRGSLTTSPFAGGIQWVVFANPVTAAESIDRFAARFPEGNTRAVRRLHGRTVHVSREHS